jgi:hypothetical protein
MARSVGAFTSNKLAWLSDKLSTTKKSEHKKFPGHALWREYLAGNPAARKEMKLYNVDDILSMEEVYLALRPYYERHPNLATYFADDTRRCPKCGSVDLVRDGFTYTQVSRYERFVCRACTGWCNGRRTTNTPTKRKSLLGN